MQIVRNGSDTSVGPEDWFSGTVYFDPIATPSGTSRLRAISVHFTPGARTAWHTHPNGQALYVTEGVGLAQRRGGPIEVILKPGADHHPHSLKDPTRIVDFLIKNAKF